MIEKIDIDWVRPDLYFFTDHLLKFPMISGSSLLHHNSGYLPPFKKELLNFFSAQDLERAVEWKENNNGRGDSTLPLKSSRGPSPVGRAVISRFYKRDEIINPWATKLVNPPFLALWPDSETLHVKRQDKQSVGALLRNL